nr:MAG TPA: hypothetical protein [Crassvirales sp.]
MFARIFIFHNFSILQHINNRFAFILYFFFLIKIM